jgi:hypothetical protein
MQHNSQQRTATTIVLVVNALSAIAVYDASLSGDGSGIPREAIETSSLSTFSIRLSRSCTWTMT